MRRDGDLFSTSPIGLKNADVESRCSWPSRLYRGNLWALIQAMVKNNSFWNLWTYFWVASFDTLCNCLFRDWISSVLIEVGGVEGNVLFLWVI